MPIETTNNRVVKKCRTTNIVPENESSIFLSVPTFSMSILANNYFVGFKIALPLPV